MSQQQGEYVTRQIPTDVSGFIPVFEIIMRQYSDHMTALVFGRMWQYCGMEDAVCRASLERIGKDLEISRATVFRHAKILVADGYLIDTTPDRRNRPHVYIDAGKVVMKNSILGMSQKNSGVSEKNRGVSESHMIKQGIKQKIKKEGATPPALKSEKPKASDFPAVMLYREVVGKSPNSVTYQIITDAMDKISARLGHVCTAADLIPYFKTWMTKSSNERNFSVWLLEWAVSGSTEWQAKSHPESNPPRRFPTFKNGVVQS